MDCTHFATFPLHSRRIGLVVNPSIYLEITLDRRTPATKIRYAVRADQTRMRSYLRAPSVGPGHGICVEFVPRLRARELGFPVASPTPICRPRSVLRRGRFGATAARHSGRTGW